MKYLFLVAAAWLAVGAPPSSSAQDAEGIYTLYRNSVLDGTARIHVATFNTDNGKNYNAENCSLVADLLQQQEGVNTRFWCEPGDNRGQRDKTEEGA